MPVIIPASVRAMLLSGLSIPTLRLSRRPALRALGARMLLGAGLFGMFGVGAAQAETALPAAHDLQASAARAARHGQPLVLMFSLPDCAYCEQLRRNTYRWMLRDGIDVEQVEMLGSAPLRGFQGRATDGRALAAHYGVGLAPTVLFLGPDGQELGERIVGAGVPDFYQADVDRSMRQAHARLRGG